MKNKYLAFWRTHSKSGVDYMEIEAYSIAQAGSMAEVLITGKTGLTQYRQIRKENSDEVDIKPNWVILQITKIGG